MSLTLQVVENRWEGGRSRQRVVATLGRERGWQYILGARMRSQNEVKDDVLSRGGRYRVVHPERVHSDDPSPLKVKEVCVDQRRYIVCLNDDEARKDAADREAIVTALREQLRNGDKSLVGNKGYRRYLAGCGPDHFQVDEAKITEDARYDGKWVLRTNTALDSAEEALPYKRLWTVKHWFRSCKSLLQTRPIFHKCDVTIRGHVFCSFLALVLRQELQARLEERGHKFEWADVIQDLDRLQLLAVEQDGKRFLLRSDETPTTATHRCMARAAARGWASMSRRQDPEGSLGEVDDPGVRLALGLVHREHPAAVLEVDVARLDRHRLLGPATGFSAHCEQVTKLNVPNQGDDGLELFGGDDVLPASRPGPLQGVAAQALF